MPHPAVQIVDGKLRCNRCREEKETSEFNRHSYRKCGFCAECRSCANARCRNHYGSNPSAAVERVTKWQKSNPEKKKLNKRASYFRNRETILKKQGEYAKANADRIRERQKEWRTKNDAQLRAKRKALRIEKPEIVRQWEERGSKKKRSTPEGRILANARARLWQAVVRSGGRKSNRTLLLIGCTQKELRAYIEALWLPGMSWDNYGVSGWHIDHIKPCASFDLTKPEEQARCFHYSNLQPLWAEDNLKKASTLN